MTNKVVREKSRCADCMVYKSTVLKQKLIKKVIGTRLILNFSYTNHYKHVDVLFEAPKKKKKNKKKKSKNFKNKKMIRQYYHQNVLYVLVENQDLRKNKKKRDY